MANEIIKADDTLTPTGWIAPADLSLEDWQQVGESIGNAGKTLGWIIGDWFNAYPGEWGNMYDEAMALTGLGYDRLQRLKSVSSSIELRFRNRNLKIGHHEQVTKYRDDPDLQTYWLTLAEKNKWSARALAEAIKEDEAKKVAIAHREQEDIPVFAEPTISPVVTCPTCKSPYDKVTFEYGCPYCYKEKNDLDGWVDGLPEKMEEESKPEQAYTNDAIRINARSNNIWHTPLQYIKSARIVLGIIDLDPASSQEANEIILASSIFTEDDNGLEQNWRGRVWLNPPYGRIAADFTSKLIEEHEAGNVSEAILLINSNVTDTKWFQPLWDYTLCFTDHRINFYSPQNTDASGSTHGSLFVYLGKNTKRFCDEFKRYGATVRRVDG